MIAQPQQGLQHLGTHLVFDSETVRATQTNSGPALPKSKTKPTRKADEMFDTVGGVVTALKTFRDFYGPKSTSIMTPGNGNIDIDSDPFRRGFLTALEARTDLLKRLASLDERERAVVTLWYVADLPVREICDRLQLSRSHLYRIRDRALKSMSATDPADIEISEATA